MNFAERRDRLRSSLTESFPDGAVQGMLVTSLANIRYLTGFTGSNAVLYVGIDDSVDDVLATDGRYELQAAAECAELPILIDRSTLGFIGRQLAGAGVVSVAIEDALDIGEVDVVREHLRQVVSSASLVEELRIVKDVDELALLASACAITAQAMLDVVGEITAGWTEIAVARRLEQRFGELGADDRSFSTIVAAGGNAGLPHHRPTRAELVMGDLLVIDAGATVGGYHADMTRTFVVGAAADWQRELHACVAEAAQRARAASVPGIERAALDAVARDCIVEAGWGPEFSHGLGHGVGLEIHEAPMIGPRAIGRLSASTPITIEPGIYLAGQGGVRIEDTVVVGSGAVLTEADRSLLSVG